MSLAGGGELEKEGGERGLVDDHHKAGFAFVAPQQPELTTVFRLRCCTSDGGPACTSGKAWSRRGWMEGFILGVVKIVGAWRGDRFRVDELSVLGG